MPKPSEILIFTTLLPPDKVAERIGNALTPYKGFELSPLAFVRNTQNIFSGSLQGDTFNIHRIQFYKSSKHPLLKGKILPNGNGTRVEVEVFINMGTKTAYIFIGIAILLAIIAVFAFAPYTETATITAILLAVSLPIAMFLTGGQNNSYTLMAEKQLKKIITL